MKDTAQRRPEGPEAVLVYAPGSYRVVKPGAYVTCAVTGVPIALEDLRYWSAEHGEPYADAKAATRAWERRQRDT